MVERRRLSEGMESGGEEMGEYGGREKRSRVLCSGCVGEERWVWEREDEEDRVRKSKV